MLAGFVDRRGRMYDVNFRTLRTRLLDEGGNLMLREGEVSESEATCEGEATVTLGSRTVPFLLRSAGGLTQTTHRFVFIVGERAERPPEQLTRFNVKLPLHPDAMSSFFRDQGGREFLEFEAGDVVAAREDRRAISVGLRGPSPLRVGEAAEYTAIFSPAGAARHALGTLL